MNQESFNYAISLGCACNTSLYLKELGLKQFSLPYDWIFSNLDTIEHTIKDDFNSFLDKNLIDSVNQKRASHNLYHSFLFNHRNPKDNENDYQYYQRCIDRFKQVLKSDCNKLFIHTMYKEHDKYHKSFMKFGENFKNFEFNLDRIKKFDCFLSSITHNYTLLVILQNPKQSVSKYTKILDSENLFVYVLDCVGVSAGELLANAEDSSNYKEIIKQFNFEPKQIESKIPLES